jgi:hypothetical protein
MEEISKLLSLPWATLVMLASGFVGYYVANVGIREHHKPLDIAFSIVVFGFLSAFAYYTCKIVFDLSLVWSSGITFVSAMLVGGAWRLVGRRSFETLLRNSRISYSDDLPSAWVALFDAKNEVTQLSVKLKDGTWLMCDDLSKFSASPNGPCIFGAKGDILMYVTHTQSVRAIAFVAAADPISNDWGHEITYIPADQIARVDLRRKV